MANLFRCGSNQNSNLVNEKIINTISNQIISNVGNVAYLTNTGNTTITSDGFVVGLGNGSNGVEIRINGTNVGGSTNSNVWSQQPKLIIAYVKNGDVVYTNGSGTRSFAFCPI